MNIIQDLIPAGRRNRPAKLNPCNYITIHNTGNTAKSAGAKNHANYLKGDAAAAAPVSWHYTVDDVSIYRHLPDNETAFHAGNTVGNTQSIGIEICMNDGADLRKATDNAVWLTAELCKKHGIPLDRVVQHNIWWGKDCPQMLRGGKPYSWNTFLRNTESALNPPKPAPVMKDKPSDWARGACESAVKSGLLAGDGKGWFGWGEPVSLERLMTILDKWKGIGK
jgi:N-acetylmuramoyl-L-alanine amidase CwlA